MWVRMVIMFQEAKWDLSTYLFYPVSLTPPPPPVIPCTQHVLLFFVQLVVAIDHVHRLKILHRDLKTQNIMMNRKRTILKIGDFGISKVLSSKITSAQTVCAKYWPLTGCVSRVTTIYRFHCISRPPLVVSQG